jgi:hypothetical protein
MARGRAGEDTMTAVPITSTEEITCDLMPRHADRARVIPGGASTLRATTAAGRGY